MQCIVLSYTPAILIFTALNNDQRYMHAAIIDEYNDP